ncbi:MAG TPA: GH92 family glycosyl hydrolase [Ktedonobacteraceae bacterium]|nr:GH92 family glycosyl hydrolase [Ktedonobacteraceae bacterium]
MARRLFLSCVVLLTLFTLLVAQSLAFQRVPTAHAASLATQNLVQYVNPFIGTGPSNAPNPVGGGAGGSTYPGAVVPFGMVQFSPDTPNASPSGYLYSDTTINDFSLTHFDGAGCANNDDLEILPVTGSLGSSPGSNWTSYAASYSKSNESASPGYYKTVLNNSNTTVELTATTRTGMARFTYPGTTQATVLINSSRSATGSRNGSISVNGSQVTGSETAGGFCGSSKTFVIYYAIQFDQTPTSHGTWLGSSISAGSNSTSGTNSGAYVTFNTTSNAVVQMKIALSYVSIANAQQNLSSENSAWSFSTVQSNASNAWNTMLNRVQVSGGTSDDLTKFYTALYHVMQSPNVASDVNGQYMGFDNAVHTASSGLTIYQNYSGWDIYRSWAALVALIAPDVMNNIAESMVLDGQQGGEIPKWSQETNEDFIMTGDPGPIVVASAYAFGARSFDTSTALSLMNNVGTNTGAKTQGSAIRGNLGTYLNLHYIPGNSSDSLEYSASDFAIAQFAQAMGNTSMYNTFMSHAQWWSNVFDSDTGYITPRNSNGTWATPLDPTSNSGFTEGNAAQYTWMVPYNLSSVINLMGGSYTAVQRLDHLFTQYNAGLTQPYFYMGNEPEFATPWAYTYAGAPWGTQINVRNIITQVFTTAAGGLPGNDDLGATSAWYVWSALGLYPSVPGADTLVLHGPEFASETIQLANSKILQINGSGAADNAPYVQSLTVNGTATSKTWLRYGDIANGATLNFTMGTNASSWGSNASDVPPSFNDGFTPPAQAPNLGTNLALHKTVTASSPCASSEVAANAVDGVLKNNSKWCSSASPLYLQVDLGSNQSVGSFVIKHSGLGGETTAWNTSAYNIQLSTDGSTWNTVVNVSGSTASRTYNTISPQTARYVRLNITTPTGNGNNAARIYEFEVYAAGSQGGSSFSTSFESGQPQPTWSSTVDSSGGGLSNVGGICCGLSGPEAATRGELGHTGTTALMYSGLDNNTTTSYAYMEVFDVSGQSLTVGSGTTLSYWIYPQSSSDSTPGANLTSGSNSACVAIDLIFSDGSDLRDSGATDQNGVRVHPAYQCGHLTMNAWNHVVVNLGSYVSGKTIVRVNVGYDQPANTGGYRGYIDDISIG